MSSSGASNVDVQEKRGGNDPAWEWGKRVPNKANKVACNFCKLEFGGGITRFKEHLAHVSGNVRTCSLVSEEVKQKALGMLTKSKKIKEGKVEGIQHLLSEVRIGEDDEDETEESSRISSCQGKGKGRMDQFIASRTPEEVVGNTRQPTIQTVLPKKKGRDDVIRYIARFFYEEGIAFNVAELPSFMQMVFAIGKYGQTFQPPIPYELSETFLQREVAETDATINTFQQS